MFLAVVFMDSLNFHEYNRYQILILDWRQLFFRWIRGPYYWATVPVVRGTSLHFQLLELVSVATAPDAAAVRKWRTQRQWIGIHQVRHYFCLLLHNPPMQSMMKEQTSFSPIFLNGRAHVRCVCFSQSFWRVTTNHPMLAANQRKYEVLHYWVQHERSFNIIPSINLLVSYSFFHVFE